MWSDQLTSQENQFYFRRMPLSPVERRSVTDDVFEQILADVVAGELRAGSSLPSERRLAELLGVSRPVVREALQRLAQAGLVEVRHGGATTVRDFTRYAGLDLLPRLLLRGGDLDLGVVRSILEARLAVGPEVAALAAHRGTPDLDRDLDQAVDRLTEADDPVAMQRQALVFWDHLVDGADSVVFRLMFNSLRAAYEPGLEALAAVMEPEVTHVGGYRAVGRAVRDRDARAAREAAAALLAPTTSHLLTAISEMEKLT
jgi:DNA-binding FadR family transcriptional regulator